MISICAGCGARVLWVETSAGTRLVVDINPCAAGEIAIALDQAEGKLRAWLVLERLPPPPPQTIRHQHHHRTCTSRATRE